MAINFVGDLPPGWAPMPDGVRIVQEASSGIITMSIEPPALRMSCAEALTVALALRLHATWDDHEMPEVP